MSFLYFVPELRRETIKAGVLIKSGLGDVLRDRLDNTSLSGSGRLALASVVHGPAGQSGVILKPLTIDERDGEADRVGYYPEEQEWLKVDVAGTPGYWVGWDPKKMPTADELARDTFVTGSLEELSDGGMWECPIVRLINRGVGLPDVWGLENGLVVSRVKKNWLWAWDLSGEVWSWVDSKTSIPLETVFGWAARTLGINYRVGPIECSILGLMGAAESRSVLLLSVNGPFVEKLRQADQASVRASGDSGVPSDSSGSDEPEVNAVPDSDIHADQVEVGTR